MSRLYALVCAVSLLGSLRCASAQGTPAPAPEIRLQGLRAANAHGSFKASAYLPDGSLVLLYDQGDGLRLLRTDATAGSVLGQAQTGAAGDFGIALTIDPAGNIYVAGTSSSGLLAGTPGAAYPTPADTSTNSFLAKFNSQLELVFLTFLGAGRTEVTGVAATPDAVFVTGANYNGTLPTTAGALQRTPPNRNYGTGNGFVQRFTPDGTALAYATYLSGADGGSVPAAIVARPDDTVYIAGETSASTFPVVNALQPTMAGPVSGFVAQLSSDGSALPFSTFIAGAGISSLALDSATNILLATGDLSWGEFPVGQVSAPVANIPYQSLLRFSADGQNLIDSALLLPGTRSFVTAGPGGTAWVAGALTVPLSPETMNRGEGDSYVLHVSSSDGIDQVQRLGGSATSNPSFAHLSSTLSAPSLSPDGQSLTVAGTVFAQTDSSLRAAQSFDLGLNAGGSSVLPNGPGDLLPASCAAGQGCNGSGALLTQLDLNGSHAGLTLSTADAPNILLRNTGSVSATGLAMTAGGFTDSTDCADTLPAFAQCTVLLGGSGPGTLSITGTDAAPLTAAIPGPITQPPALAFDTPELDFGIVTAGAPSLRVLTVRNLGSMVQTFTSAPENVPSASPYTLAEVGGTCPGPASAHTLAPGASCTLQIGLTASALPQNDGPVQASWRIGARDIRVTGFTQAASLSLSSSEIDFGAQPAGTRLSRFLYLSNSSAAPIANSPVSLPPQSPFAVQDGCPSLLLPGSVCGITLSYSQPNAPVFDSGTLTLDAGLTVLLTGETLASTGAPILTALSPLAVSPTTVQFSNAVPVTQQSAEIQTVQVTNPTGAALPLSASALGDFNLGTGCGATLPAGATCSITLTFAPSAPGTRQGVLRISTAPGTQPTTVPLQATAIPILSSTNGTVDLGQTTVAEPTVTWLPLGGSFPQLTVSATGPGFTVALLPDDGDGHGTLPPAAFAPTATAQCTACWLAVQFLPQAPGSAEGTVQLASAAAGHPYGLALRGAAVPGAGLILTPAQPSFGAVPIAAASSPLTFVLTNLLAQPAAVSLQAIGATGDFALLVPQSPTACTGPLQPTASCSVDVVFIPTAKGERNGTLTVTTGGGTAAATLLGIGIAGNAGSSPPGTGPPPGPPGVTVFPAQADFGAQPVTAVPAIRQFTLRNTTSSAGTVTFAPTKNFPLPEPSGCGTLAAGASCNFAVVFVPGEGGPLTGSVTITFVAEGSASTAQTVLYLRGYGTATGGLVASSGTDPQSPLRFGTVQSGSSVSRTVTLTNTGTAPHSLRRLSSTTPFAAASGCAQALPPGGSCDLIVTYSAVNQLPATATQTPRTDVGTLLLETDTDASPTSVYLTGIALPTPAHVDPGAATLPTYTLSQTALTFPDTQPGMSSPAQDITATNNGTVPVIFGDLQPSAGFYASTTCHVLQPAQTCLITVSFHPAQLSGEAVIGALEIPSNAAASLEFVTLLGSAFPAQLQLSPQSLDFPAVPVGQSTEETLSVTNVSDLPLVLPAFTLSGDFSAQTSSCPLNGAVLAAGQSCTLLIAFTPSAAGARTGTLTSSAGLTTSPQSVSLTGTGLAGQLQVRPGSLDFGSVPLTTAAAQTLTLANVGTAPLGNLTMTLAGAAAPDFTVSFACPGTALAVGAACTVQLSFAPSAPGQRAASLAITSTDPASPTLVPLTGTGAQPPGFTLFVNGNTSVTADIDSGGSAAFPLTLTSQGGYTGPIALRCTPIAPARNAQCSLAAAQLMLTGSSVASSVSVATSSGLRPSLLLPFGLWTLLPWTALRSPRRRKRARRRLAVALASVALATAFFAGCGGPGSTGNPYTPAGTYQYQVTAASTTGPALSSSVMLTVTVH